MAVDPFTLAAGFINNQNNAAQQERNNTQNMLMTMFQTEASRQKPYNDYPIQRALNNQQSQNALNNSMTMAEYNNGIKTRREAQLKLAPEAIRKTITSVAQQAGEDANFFMQLADTESGFNPTAQNKNSSAGGLFQFLDKTAAGLGLSAQDKFNPEASMRAAVLYNNQNRTHLTKVLGREPTQGELYLAWQQGAGGAEKLLTNPNAPAESIVGVDAVRLNGGRRGMTAGQFAGLWTDKFQSGYNRRIANLRKPKPEGEEDNGFGQYSGMVSDAQKELGS